jgi:D-3-phosphoglycerate dehydrogenase
MPGLNILLTHTDVLRESQFSAEILAELAGLAELRLNRTRASLRGPALLQAAADAQVIVCDPQTPGDAALFAACPRLVAFISSPDGLVDVTAASALGVLVVRAEPQDIVRQLRDILQGRAPDGAVNTDEAHRLRRLAPPLAPEVGGTEGPEPTRYGDWQHKGRVSDF